MLLYAALAVLAVAVPYLVWRVLRGGELNAPRPVAFPPRVDPFASPADPFAPPAAPLPPLPFASSSPFAPSAASPFAPDTSDVDAALRAEVTPLLLRGDKIGAIKLYRERTGASLLDAKNTIESWAVARAVAVAGPLPEREAPRWLDVDARPALLAECAELAARGDKIGAIKRWRAATDVGLADAKNLVDAILAHGVAGVPADVLARAWPVGEPGAVIAEGPPPVMPSPRPHFTPPPLVAGESEALLAECVATARRGDKIGAIKRWRERTGCGLREAKDVIEAALRGA